MQLRAKEALTKATLAGKVVGWILQNAQDKDLEAIPIDVQELCGLWYSIFVYLPRSQGSVSFGALCAQGREGIKDLIRGSRSWGGVCNPS